MLGFFFFTEVLQLEADNPLERKKSGCCVQVPGIFRFSLNMQKLMLNFCVFPPFPKLLPLNLLEKDQYSCEIFKDRGVKTEG